MSRYRTQLATVCAALNAHEVRYVLVGASAMQMWGTTRATQDIDVLIDPTVSNAVQLLAALRTLGVGLAQEWLAEEIVGKPVTVIGDIPRVDILTVAWSVRYPEAAEDATMMTLESVRIPVASLDHLIASKRTGRLQDAADIEILEEIQRRVGR